MKIRIVLLLVVLSLVTMACGMGTILATPTPVPPTETPIPTATVAPSPTPDLSIAYQKLVLRELDTFTSYVDMAIILFDSFDMSNEQWAQAVYDNTDGMIEAIHKIASEPIPSPEYAEFQSIMQDIETELIAYDKKMHNAVSTGSISMFGQAVIHIKNVSYLITEAGDLYPFLMP